DPPSRRRRKWRRQDVSKSEHRCVQQTSLVHGVCGAGIHAVTADEHCRALGQAATTHVFEERPEVAQREVRKEDDRAPRGRKRVVPRGRPSTASRTTGSKESRSRSVALVASFVPLSQVGRLTPYAVVATPYHERDERALASWLLWGKLAS